MLDKRSNPDIQQVDDRRLPPAKPDSGLSPAGRTLLIAAISLSVWSAVMLGLVSAGALQIAPAIVLIFVAAIVLGVEVRRAQRRNPRRNRFGELTERRIETSDIAGLLEIEHASVREERRVLLAREFCRLASNALQPDPAQRTTWPDAETLASWRGQIALLAASAGDRSAEQLPIGRPVGNITDADLADAINTLRQYVDRLARLQRIATEDPEPVRQLIRDQSRLRALQDQIVSYLREPASNDSSP
ncbi:MAG TPA: hypothetical protein VF201_07650 [Nitrolancea sp.]